MRRETICKCCASVVLVAMPHVTSAALSYSIVSQVAIPGTPTAVTLRSVNSLGEVAGAATVTVVPTGSFVTSQRAVISGPFGGSAQTVAPLYSSGTTGSSQFYGINDSGQAVGGTYILTTSTGTNVVAGGTVAKPSAAIYSGGTLTSLGSLGGTAATLSTAFGINDAGVVVGSASIPGSTSATHAFMYNGAMNDLGTLPGGTTSSATAISGGGIIVGTSQTTTSTHIWSYNSAAASPQMVDLGLGTYTAQGSTTATNTYDVSASSPAISANGNFIVGTGYNNSGGSFGVALLSSNGGPLEDIGYLYTNTATGVRRSMTALGVDSYGDVVGQTTNLSGYLVGFIDLGGTLYDPNLFLPAGYTGGRITSVTSINDAGYITATAYVSPSSTNTGVSMGLLLYVPEPSFAGLAMPVALVALRRRRT